MSLTSGYASRSHYFWAGATYLHHTERAGDRLEPAVFATAEEADVGAFRVNTIAFTPGIQWLARPNVKLAFEYQVRQAREEDRALAQLHLSF